jgi:hypothetical protein
MLIVVILAVLWLPWLPLYQVLLLLYQVLLLLYQVLIVVAPLTSGFVPFQPPVEVEAYTEEFDATDDGNICPQVQFYQIFNGCNQGVLTEGESSVQLASFMLAAFDHLKMIYFLQTRYLNEEVICTKPSPPVSASYCNLHMLVIS